MPQIDAGILGAWVGIDTGHHMTSIRPCKGSTVLMPFGRFADHERVGEAVGHMSERRRTLLAEHAFVDSTRDIAVAVRVITERGRDEVIIRRRSHESRRWAIMQSRQWSGIRAIVVGRTNEGLQYLFRKRRVSIGGGITNHRA